MNFRDSDEEHAFRLRLRKWLEENRPTEDEPTVDSERERFLAEWHHRLSEGGWLGLGWPVELGGQGLPDGYEAIVDEELARADAPAKPAVVNYLGRSIAAFGSEALKARFLPRLLDGTERWCEGFSEPGAGSDLASLRTRAVRDGELYRVTGHKIWTSDGVWADWCVVLARTDPDAPKHKGISALIVDMHAPGVTVQPIVQITGKRDFCEVFFDDVEVPADRMVGSPGDGWAFVMQTLAYERGPGDLGFIANFARDLDRLERQVAGEDASPGLRLKVAQAYVDIEVLRQQTARSLSLRAANAPPGPESSIGKLLMTRTEQSLQHVAMEVYGGAPLLGDQAETLGDYLFSRGQSIMGGTEQIQKNIVAQRLLGMPKEPVPPSER